MNPTPSTGYNRAMPGMIAKAAALLALTFMVATSATAQTHRKHAPPEAEHVEHAAPAAPVDKRDSIVTGAGAFNGRPYWLALAQCGGIYFKLNTLYTDAAVRARVVKPDPRANDEYTRKLNEAIKAATAFFDGAERFLMTDRNIERADAVLTYDGQSRAAGERLKAIDAALAAAKACPTLYQACQAAYPKQCNETLPPMS